MGAGRGKSEGGCCECGGRGHKVEGGAAAIETICGGDTGEDGAGNRE